MLFSKPDKTQQLPLPLWDLEHNLRRSSLGGWAHLCLCSNQHLDWFSHFCRAH